MHRPRNWKSPTTARLRIPHHRAQAGSIVTVDMQNIPWTVEAIIPDYRTRLCLVRDGEVPIEVEARRCDLWRGGNGDG